MNTTYECETCAHNVDGKCLNREARAEFGECGHYEGCTGWCPRTEEDIERRYGND